MHDFCFGQHVAYVFFDHGTRRWDEIITLMPKLHGVIIQEFFSEFPDCLIPNVDDARCDLPRALSFL